MRLVTVDVAAKELHVSPGLVRHWIRRGWLERHARPRHPLSERYRPQITQERFYVDVDAASLLTSDGSLKKFRSDHPDKNLLTAREIAKRLGVTYETVVRMLSVLQVTKYRYHNDSTAYVVDGDELHSKMEDDYHYSVYLAVMRLKKVDF